MRTTRTRPPAAAPRRHPVLQPGLQTADWLVLGLLILALLGGWALRSSTESQVKAYDQGGVALSYPADWRPRADAPADAALSLQGIESTSAFQPILTVSTEPLSATNAMTVSGQLVGRTMRQTKALAAFRSLGGTPTTVSGNAAIINDFAYAYDPAGSMQDSVAIPVMVRTEEVLVQRGSQLTVVSFATAAEDWERLQPVWDRIRASLQLK